MRIDSSQADGAERGFRWDDLGRNSLVILQDPKGYCFAMDSVLLADFASASAGERVLDLCTGSGVVMLLMEARYPGAHYTGIEIQEALWRRACASIERNHLGDEVTCLRGDIREVSSLVEAGSMDVVTANPPYMKVGSGKVNPNPEKALARHEIECSLRDVTQAAYLALKEGGRFYMVHRAEREEEIMKALAATGFCVSSLRRVVPREGEKPNLILIESRKTKCYDGTENHLSQEILPPLLVYQADGSYTNEIEEIYGHGR